MAISYCSVLVAGVCRGSGEAIGKWQRRCRAVAAVVSWRAMPRHGPADAEVATDHRMSVSMKQQHIYPQHVRPHSEQFTSTRPLASLALIPYPVPHQRARSSSTPMADGGRKRALDSDAPTAIRKKLRPSELPLSQAKRSAIDHLTHTFRKKGHYDTIRKDLMAQYTSGVSRPCSWIRYSANPLRTARQGRARVGPARPGRPRDRPQPVAPVQGPPHGRYPHRRRRRAKRHLR